MDPSGFVLISDYVPGVIQEIRYHSTYNFVGERIDGYEEPVALITIEAARALKSVAHEMNVQRRGLPAPPLLLRYMLFSASSSEAIISQRTWMGFATVPPKCPECRSFFGPVTLTSR